MKKLFSTYLFVFIAGISFSQNALKIGYINSFELTLKEQKLIEQKRIEFGIYYDKFQQDYNAKIIDFSNRASILTTEQNQQKNAELMDSYKELEVLKLSLEDRLKKYADSLLYPLKMKINYFVQSVGRENNYDFIIDNSAISVFCNDQFCDNLNPYFLKGAKVSDIESNYNANETIKTGYLDFNQYITNSDEFKIARDALQKKIQDSDQEFKTLESELIQKMQNLQQSNYTPEELVKIQTQLLTEQRNLQEAFVKRKAELDAEQENTFGTIKDNVEKIITDFAVENKYAFVIDVSAVIYASANFREVSAAIYVQDLELSDENSETNAALNISYLNSEEFIANQPYFVKNLEKIENDKRARWTEIAEIRKQFVVLEKEGDFNRLIELHEKCDSLLKENEAITKKQIDDLMQNTITKCREKITEKALEYKLDIIFDNQSGFLLYTSPDIVNFPFFDAGK